MKGSTGWQWEKIFNGIFRLTNIFSSACLTARLMARYCPMVKHDAYCPTTKEIGTANRQSDCNQNTRKVQTKTSAKLIITTCIAFS